MFSIMVLNCLVIDSAEISHLHPNPQLVFLWNIGPQGAAYDCHSSVDVNSALIQNREFAKQLRLNFKCVCSFETIFSRDPVELMVAKDQENTVKLSELRS
ncbi:hypothetical protein CISG_05466 [Coccidioides immitis RMSCC 3703]|uniref:Uncharacterized protein n=2 Tax=Coccidioides immitis TaxID=5501 RepID=A0A0J8QU41_COCIT|nr:hypothetical protein CIRG_00638 [Coccidioides immitis RMSCC 2394]KMU75981.1 hypothetical protein CISG_05466 [Coccidioides immitis RMSCC 3703]